MTSASATGFDQELYDAALVYLRAGLSLIPVSAQTKRPVEQLLPMDPDTGRGSWKPYQERQPTDDEIRYWIAHGAQIAVVCGAVSDGLLILDFDEARFYAAWLTTVGDLANGLPVQKTGGGGYQVFLRCPEPGQNDKLAWLDDASEQAGRRIAIETRAEGGYAVLPPSLHPSGNRYAWLSETLRVSGQIDIARSQAVADALLAAARKLDEAPYTKQQLEAMQQAMLQVSQHRQSLNGSSSAIDAYNQHVSIDQALLAYGYRHCYGSRYSRPGGTSASIVVQGGKSWHHSTNDPLNDNHWHDAFDLFCLFEHANDAKAAAKAASIMLCLPPLAHTVATPAPSMQHSTSSPQASQTATPPWESIQSLLAQQFPEPTWIIPDLLSAGVTLCAGRPKRARKSWLMLNLAVAVAGTGTTLGDLDVTHGDVLYLALEDSDRRLQMRVEKMLVGGPMPTAFDFDYATEWQRFDQMGLDQIELWLQTHKAARLVVVDTLAKVRPPQKPGSVYDQDYAALHGLMGLAKRYTDVAFIVVHHTRKASTEDAIEEISGSFGLTGGVDDTWIIKRDGEDATLHAIGRNLPREKDLALEWHEETATWSIAGDADDYKVSKQRRQVLELLSELEPGEGLTPREIADILDRPGGTVRKLLFDMTKAGLVERVGRGRYTRTFTNMGPTSDPAPKPVQLKADLEPEPVAPVAVLDVSDEWQEVPEGVAVPAGCDIRMDMESNKTFARKLQQRPVADSGYDHDKIREREARELLKQRKYDKARLKTQSLRGRLQREALLSIIDQVERGEVTLEDSA